MKSKRKKKYTLVYEVEVEARNLEEAEDIGDRWETKDKARLKRIEGKNESWEIFFDDDPSVRGMSPLKAKRK